jgi:hypothetical protein
VVVFADGDAAATARSTRMNLSCDALAEDREVLRFAVANELVVDPFGVMPRFLARLYYLIHRNLLILILVVK